MADNAQTSLHGIISATSQSPHLGARAERAEEHGLRHPLHSVEAQRAPAAAQETPGMCLCPYKSF